MILVICIIALGVADVLLTNRIISNGGIELNPLVGWCMDTLGAWWWVPKMVLTIGVSFGLWTLNTSVPLWVVLVIQMLVVAWNIKEIVKGEQNG